jgi:Zn-dependent peptidase ImmA (M78 family)
MSDQPRTRGDAIRELYAQGWTQTQLAKHFKITRQAIRYHTIPRINAQHKAYGRKWRAERSKNDREWREAENAKQRARYASDPAYRERLKAAYRRKALKKKEKRDAGEA